MNTKHTPGPWKVGYFNDVRTGDGHRSLANVSSSFELPAKANARLIAAAPELLAFAQMIANGGINAAGEFTIESEARALITKATGLNTDNQ